MTHHPFSAAAVEAAAKAICEKHWIEERAMNQAAKDAVALLDDLKYREKWSAPDKDRTIIIAGLELLRGVADGTHIIRPKELVENA